MNWGGCSYKDLKNFIEDSLSFCRFDLFRAFSLALKRLNPSCKAFAHNKYFGIAKNLLLFFFLCAIPTVSIFMKDYVTDQVSIANVSANLDKSLKNYGAEHKRLFYHLHAKILSEKLYQDHKRARKALADLVPVASYLKHFALKKFVGIRLITPDMEAIGPYGRLQNFTPTTFLVFLRCLEQTPNHVHLIRINGQAYLGMGIAEEKDIKGYLLLPTSLEELNKELATVKTSITQLTLSVSIPAAAIPLETFITKAPSYLQIEKTFDWFDYFARNFIIYLQFMLFALMLLWLKKKQNDQKKGELLKMSNKLDCLGNSLLSQHKATNIILSRLHEGIESIYGISALFLEAKEQAHPNVFNEKETTHLVKAIHKTSRNLIKPVLAKRADSQVDIVEIIHQCLSFYAHKIEQESIQINQNYTLRQALLTTDQDAFLQLMLNLFHQALERTPERGEIWITMRQPKGIKDCLHIITLEDNGYSFSPEDLSHFRQHETSLFNTYFELEWQDLLYLAQSLDIKIVFESLSSLGNRLTLQIFQKKNLAQQPLQEKNVVWLFPASGG